VFSAGSIRRSRRAAVPRSPRSPLGRNRFRRQSSACPPLAFPRAILRFGHGNSQVIRARARNTQSAREATRRLPYGQVSR
jgi:hypothetical protein